MNRAAANRGLNIMNSPAAGARLLAATVALSLLGTLTSLAQSKEAQPSTQNIKEAQPSTQNIDELKRKLAELQKEVQNLRQSVKQLEEQQKRAAQKESESASKKSSPAQPSSQGPGAAGGQGGTGRQRPISQVAKRDTVKRDQQSVARINNQPLDLELIGFFQIPGTKDKLKIDGYAKLDVIMDPRPAGDPDEFVTTTIPVNLTPAQKVTSSNVIFRESRISLDFRSPFRED